MSTEQHPQSPSDAGSSGSAAQSPQNPSLLGQSLLGQSLLGGAAAANPAPSNAFSPVPDSFYEQVGGAETFSKLVHEFYLRVAQDPILRPLYPEEDLAPAERRLRMFLEQYWGGPRTYLQERGHPRLRMRHAPFAVTPAARDRWLELMRAAQDTLDLPPLLDATLWDYLDRAAHSLVNTPG